MRIVFLSAIFFQDVLSFRCDGEMVGSCQCDVDKRATYQLHCPSYQPGKKRLDVLVKDKEFAQVSCVRGATQEEVFSLLKTLQLGNLKTLKFKQCPYPVQSYQKTMEDMGISEIQNLYISGVPGVPFDNTLLRNLTVMTIDLRYTANVDVDGNFFKNSTSIKHIRFNGIRGLRLNKHSFTGLSNLTNLGLSSCGIKDLDKDVFQNLTALDDLNLHGNRLTTLPDGIFDNLSNLTKVNLGNNLLKTLPQDVFVNNNELKEAVLSFNCFQSLPENLFAGKQNMDTFDFRRLSDKQCDGKSIGLELPSTIFQNSSLKVIKFLHIDVESLHEDLLKGCKSLTTLIIQSAYIKSIPNDLLKDSPLVEKVDFVNNDLSELDVNIFRGLTKIKTLRLSYNNISSLDPNLFTDLSNLETLHLSNNKLKDISDNLFEKNPIQELDLSRNMLSRMPVRTLEESLVTLKIDNNLISTFDMKVISTIKSLRTLNLSGNNISGTIDIRVVDTSNRSHLLAIDLSRNKIERVILAKEISKTEKVKFLLKKNPLMCDCYATEIKQINERETYNQEHNVLVPFERKTYNQEHNVLVVDMNDFVCSNNKNLLETSYSALNCPFPSEILSEECPENCTCNLNRYSRRVSVNCAAQALTQIPENLPIIPGESDGIILHMENNFLSNLTDSLWKISSNNYSNFEFISELHLSGNKLKYISDHFPSRLEYLGLDNNKIQSYQNETLQYFQAKVKQSNLTLRLGNNPYGCNCDNLELLHFLKMFYSYVEDMQYVTSDCLDKENELFMLNEEDICYRIPLITQMAPAILIIFVVLVLLIVNISYRETIMIYVFSKSWGKIFFSEDKVDINKPYDAFLSYSHHDAEFVEKTLLPGLESEDNPKDAQYKCLIHTRDWNVGDMISDQIIDSVDSCRRTIIVLSMGYVKSTWTKLEFQAAHTKAMKENTQRVIVLLHGEKPDKENIDEDLKKYLDSNTFIDTEDPWFWKKLRYALPKKSYKQKKSSRLDDVSKDRADDDNAKNIHHDISEDRVQLPYYKQFSREMLLTSESLKRDLGGTEYIC